MESDVYEVADDDGNHDAKYGTPEAKRDSFNSEASEDFAGGHLLRGRVIALTVEK